MAVLLEPGAAGTRVREAAVEDVQEVNPLVYAQAQDFIYDLRRRPSATRASTRSATGHSWGRFRLRAPKLTILEADAAA
jgi:hypothetical protein